MMKRICFVLCLIFTLCSCSVVMEGVTTVEPAETLVNPDWWHPSIGLTWQWMLSGAVVETSIKADVYDIDLFENEASVVADLKKQGSKVICYISVGSFEDWRPDANQFPPSVIGKAYADWPGERWLDIRQMELLKPIMLARLDLCKQKGFDGVEPDNIEIHDADTGFAISYTDQLAYFNWLAEAAHERGLAIGLKNAPDMVAEALPNADFAITEDAYYYGWIGEMLAFTQEGKPVFAAEYSDMAVDFGDACEWGRKNQVSFIYKERDLTEQVQFCP